MNVVDSSGWVEYFVQGQNVQFFIPPIQALDELLVPAICIYEVFKRIALDLGEESALQAVGIMSSGLIVEMDRKIALDAAQISIKHKLPMADSIILATAHDCDATLWTQDAHFKDIEGVRYIENKV
jgi:predicted nucleic acid-binding protein